MHGHVGASCDTCKVRLVSVCAAFEREDLLALQSLAQPICYGAKETLFMESDDSDAAYTVTDGVSRLYRVFADGRRQIMSFLLPGDFIDIEAGGQHGFSVDAVTEAHLCRFPKNEFGAMAARRPKVMQKLYETSARQLINAREHMMALGQQSALEKVAWFIIHLRNRWARTTLVSDKVPVPMSRQDIADYLGLTIETVSRTLTRLADDDIVAIQPGEIIITNQSRLDRLAQV